VRDSLDATEIHGARRALEAVSLAEDLLEQRPLVVALCLLQGEQALVDRLELLLRLVREGGEKKLLELVVRHRHGFGSPGGSGRGVRGA
jgi:hypothetical protein